MGYCSQRDKEQSGNRVQKICLGKEQHLGLSAGVDPQQLKDMRRNYQRRKKETRRQFIP